MLSAGPTVVAKVTDVVSSAPAVTALRIGLVLRKLATEIDVCRHRAGAATGRKTQVPPQHVPEEPTRFFAGDPDACLRGLKCEIRQEQTY